MQPSFRSFQLVAALVLLFLAFLTACGQPAPTSVAGTGGTATVTVPATASATATTVPPSASPTSRTTATTAARQGSGNPVPDLAGALGTVQVVRIQDDWSGLALDAPLLRHYQLEGKNGPFEGTAEFSAARGARQRTATINIAIPADIASAFLQALGSVAAQEGAYKPKVDHTDDYPSRVIDLDTAQGPVRFYTQSQGADAVPWGLDFAGRTYVINVDTPATALALIGPYLDDGTGEVLFDIARYAPYLAPGVTPAATPVALLAVCATGSATTTASTTPIAQAGAPVSLATTYQLAQSSALVITGQGV